MPDLADLNNRAGALVDAGQLDQADQLLDRVAQELAKRPPTPAGAADLGPAYDEYFYLCHRVRIAWTRAAYGDALAFAQRAHELERAIYRAVRGQSAGDSAAHSTGSWGLISAFTRLGRFDEARAVFEAVLGDVDFMRARLRNNRSAAEKILLAGLCVFFERGDDQWMRGAQSLIRRAEKWGPPEDAELAYGYACYWARVGEFARACRAVERAVTRGVDPERLLGDDDLRPLREMPAFHTAVVNRVLTVAISSEPSGARIIIDEVDTGLTTPAKLRPLPRGEHVIRAELDGYQSDEFRWTAAGEAHGLDVTLLLEPLANLAARAEMGRDSQRTPDESARAKTRAFVGSERNLRRAQLSVVRHTTYGLGELVMTVRGDGRARASHREFTAERRVHKADAKLSPEQVARIFAAVVDEAFTEMVIAPHRGVPDEICVSIELTNARGQSQRFSKFSQTEHARFSRLVEVVRSTFDQVLDPEQSRRLTIGGRR